MTSTNSHVFWDSCVAIRYLTETPDSYVSDIAKLFNEATAGKVTIWISTILFAEVLPHHLKKKGYGSIQDLLDDLSGACNPIGPTPPILMQAARLRDHSYMHKEPQHNEKKRVLSVPDAIHLATCLYVQDAMGISDIKFQTLDDGKNRNYEERAVSLLRYQDYSEHLADDPDVALVRGLGRGLPIQTQPAII